MIKINVGDRVQIIKVDQDNKGQLHKFGSLILVTDGVNCIVALDDGSHAQVGISQLKKVQ